VLPSQLAEQAPALHCTRVWAQAVPAPHEIEHGPFSHWSSAPAHALSPAHFSEQA
jgi:hypothetical protein